MKHCLLPVLVILLLANCKKPKNTEPSPVLLADPNVIYLEATAGDADTITIHASMNWTLSVAPGASWLSVSAGSGSSGETDIIFHSTESHYGNQNRSATITLQPQTAANIAPFTITVFQKSKTPVLNSINEITITGVGQDIDSFTIQSNVGWTIASSQSWLSLNQVSGADNDTIYFTNTEDNLSYLPRTAIITITPVGTTLIPPKVITVTQRPWVRLPGGNSYDEINASQSTPDGGFIFAGNSSSYTGDFAGAPGNGNYWLLKTDATGRKEWQKKFGGDEYDVATCVAVAADGGYVMAGFTESNNKEVTGNHGFRDIWVIKTDANGNKLWQKVIGGSSNDVAYAMLATPDGGFLLTGETNSQDGDFAGKGNKDLLILKLDANGNQQWAKFYGGENSERAYALTAMPDGGYIFAGTTSSTTGDATGNTNTGGKAWVIKTDANGLLQWQTVLSPHEGAIAKAITQTGDGGVLVCGYDYDYASTSYRQDLWLAKLNADGSIAWQKTYGGSSFDMAQAVARTSDNGFILAGHTFSNDGDITGHAGMGDIWIVRTDANGNLLWQKTVGGPNTEVINCMLPLPGNTYLLGGYTYSDLYGIIRSNYDPDGVLLKVRE